MPSPSTTHSSASFDPASLKILDALETLQGSVDSLSTALRRDPSIQQTSLQAVRPAREVRDVFATRTGRPYMPPTVPPFKVHIILRWDIWAPHIAPSHAGEPGLRGNRLAVLSHAADADVTFDFSMAPAFLDAFFRNVHIINPVLDETEIRQKVTMLALDGIGWNATACQLLLILANGAMSSSFAGSHDIDPSRTSVAKHLFAVAQKRLGTLFQTEPLVEATCFFYSGVFLMSSLCPVEAWRCFLNGLAVCQTFAICRQNEKGLVPYRAAEERLYWSCWKSERELRLELDLPDFSPPRDENPRMFPTLPDSSEDETLRSWYFYLAEISLWRIETNARTRIEDFFQEGLVDNLEVLSARVIELKAPLEAWQVSLPDVINFEPAQGDTLDILRFVLRGRLSYNMELLTWPFLAAAILGYPGLGPRASDLVLEGLRVHLDRLATNRPGFHYRHHGTWLMQRSSARSACILLAAEIGRASCRERVSR